MATGVSPPLRPMLAKGVARIPTGDGLFYEPKWDGFRCVVFVDGEDVVLGSRNTKPLTRYFPELLGPLAARIGPRAVVDGELVMVTPSGLDFDMLGQRIHPAASRIERLAHETPASFVAFDLLAEEGEDLRELPFAQRRALLERRLQGGAPPVYLSPVTRDPEVAATWFRDFEGAGFDGVMAKPGDLPYREGERTQFKIKHQREADVVVAGYRVHKDGEGVGSLLLGLFDEGRLHHIGVASSFTAARRRELVDELAPLAMGPDEVDRHPWADWGVAAAHEGEGARMPGAPNRWSGQRDHSWVPLRPERVAEVGFNQLTSGRFRHPASFVRWRPDREPESCTYDQVDVAPPPEFGTIFGFRE